MLRDLVPTLGRTRWFDEPAREMNRLMERMFAPPAEWKGFREEFPVANVAETETGFEVTVELPGLKPEDVTVEMRNGDLWITGEKKAEKEEKGKMFHRIERTYGRFERILPLPAAVREEAIEATFADGVLKVVLPKTPEAKPRHIEVKRK